MHPLFDIPADLDTPVSAYLKLAPLGRRFLLESVGRSGAGARYSFLGFGEAEEIRLDAEELARNAAGPLQADRQRAILDGLRTALASAPELGPASDEAPFRGGLVGAAGFGLARSLAGLASASGVPDYVAFAPRSVLVFDHATRRMGLLAHGTEGERRTLRREVLDALRGPVPALGGGSGTRRLVGDLVPHLDQANYLAAVDTAREAIRAGEVYQLVLSVDFRAACELEPIALYRALRLVDPSPYMYLVEFEDRAIVGASPEALLRVDGESAFAQPIAGTRPRGATPELDRLLEEELLGDPKEAAEHVMLVDLSRSDLGRVAVPGSVAVAPYREVRRYGEVMHLVSGVGATLDAEHDALDAFAAAFPAGTVVGAPKTRAMELLDELEGSPRGFYAGAVGTFGHGAQVNQAIAIRTAVLESGTISVRAGAGVVMDSSPEKEHAEVLAKTRAMRRALAIAEENLS